MRCARLPMDFDPGRLRASLEALAGSEWTAHFNEGDYEGDWSAVALRARQDAAHPILQLSGWGTGPWIDLPALDTCPYLREVLASFDCPMDSARVMRLAPGARIKEHTDPLPDHEARIHVPLQTNPEVEFRVGGERVDMHVGETWFLDFRLPHSVDNRGTTDRVHLVIDCERNAWLEGLLNAHQQ